MILDKNDSPPVFSDTPLSFNVSEDMNVGYLVSVIRASDPDQLGTLTFSLISGDEDKFLLESQTGKLRLQETLDRELKDSYTLEVRVSDGVQHTNTFVHIQVYIKSIEKLLKSIIKLSKDRFKTRNLNLSRLIFI